MEAGWHMIMPLPGARIRLCYEAITLSVTSPQALPPLMAAELTALHNISGD